MKRAWWLGLSLMTMGAFVACNGDDDYDANGNNNQSDSGVTSSSSGQTTGASSGQAGTSSGQAGASSGQAGTSSGQAGTSSGEAGSSSGEAGSSSGEAGSSSGEAGSSSGEPEPPVDEFLAACTALANHLQPVGCNDLATDEAKQAFIDSCYAERLYRDDSGDCRDPILADKQCQITMPITEFECEGNETLAKLSTQFCTEEAGEVFSCLRYGPPQVDADFMAACTELAEHLQPVGCNDLATPEAKQAFINSCYAERLYRDDSGDCRDPILADKQCQITMPITEFECEGNETLAKLSTQFCAEEAGEVFSCLRYGP